MELEYLSIMALYKESHLVRAKMLFNMYPHQESNRSKRLSNMCPHFSRQKKIYEGIEVKI